MFIPNTHCHLYRRSATTDRRGEYTFAEPVPTPCSIVDIGLKVDKTSVRADSSGSRGKADEEQGDARLLFPTYITIREGDIVEVDDEGLVIVGIYRRRNVLGQLDHLDVALNRAQLP
jgi:hypothetical protein